MKLLLLLEVVRLMYPESNDLGSISSNQEITIFATLSARGVSHWNLENLKSLAHLFKAINEIPQISDFYSA